jgi:hypothetical protein
MTNTEAQPVGRHPRRSWPGVLGYGSAERIGLAAGRLGHGDYGPGACAGRPDHAGDTRTPLKMGRMPS